MNGFLVRCGSLWLGPPRGQDQAAPIAQEPQVSPSKQPLSVVVRVTALRPATRRATWQHAQKGRFLIPLASVTSWVFPVLSYLHGIISLTTRGNFRLLKRQFIQNNQMCVHRTLEGNLPSDTHKHALSIPQDRTRWQRGPEVEHWTSAHGGGSCSQLSA